MPDLKKPNDKDKGSRSAFKNHSADEITTNDNEQSDDYNKTKIRSCAYHFRQCDCSNFAGVVGMFIYNRRKINSKKASNHVRFAIFYMIRCFLV